MSTNEIEIAAKILVGLKRKQTNEFEFDANTGITDFNSKQLKKNFEEILKEFSYESKEQESERSPVSHFSLGYHVARKLTPNTGGGIGSFEAEVDYRQEKFDILNFCKLVTSLQISYDDRFHTPSDVNTYASKELVSEIKQIFLTLDKKTLPMALLSGGAELKVQLQLALMGLLRQLLELDAQNLAKKYLEIPVEQHRISTVGANFDSLDKFRHYMHGQLHGSKKHLMPFRFLFPMADPGSDVPDELRQSKVKPFIDQIEAVFNIAFSGERPAPTNRRCVSSVGRFF